jgi:hypothetical protein
MRIILFLQEETANLKDTYLMGALPRVWLGIVCSSLKCTFRPERHLTFC